MLEERRDARDVQAEAPRGAPRAVNAGSEERVVLLPRGHTSRARQRRNPQTQARAQLQASGKHRPAAGFLIPPRSGRHCSQAPPKKLKKLQLYRGGGATGLKALGLDDPALSDVHEETRGR